MSTELTYDDLMTMPWDALRERLRALPAREHRRALGMMPTERLMDVVCGPRAVDSGEAVDRDDSGLYGEALDFPRDPWGESEGDIDARLRNRS